MAHGNWAFVVVFLLGGEVCMEGGVVSSSLDFHTCRTRAHIFLKMFTMNLLFLLFLIETGNNANTLQVLSYSYQEGEISLWLS